ncbi:MAG TPA: AI-2E family transporter [Bryobacteraceae bacterium]|nr:AI-2E family transporter [Bryobacteraceae bacterium]
MLGIDLKAARVVWTVFLVTLLVAIAYLIRETLMVFAVALFLAYMLAPLVDFVERFTRWRLTRTPALAVVYLVLVCILTLAGITVGSRIAAQASSLAERLPALLNGQTWAAGIPLPHWLESQRATIAGWLQEAIGSGGSNLLPWLKTAGMQVFSGAKYALYIVLVPILSFFFLKDGVGIIAAMVAAIADESRRQVVREILDDISLLLGQYIRSLVILSLCAFAASSLFLSITGAPYALLLAGVIGVFEVIPVIGPLAAGLLTVFVAGFSGYAHVWWFVIFWIVLRMFQDYVIQPWLMSAGVNLNPLLVLFGVLAGEQIAGVPGMFFSVPAIATLRVVYVRLARVRRNRLSPLHVE